MSLYGSRSEHGLHCLLLLTRTSEDECISSRDIADFLGLSLSFVRKLMTALEGGNLIGARSGRNGGFYLRRDPRDISVLEVIEILEPNKHVFSCQEIRQRCALFDDGIPKWVTERACEISSVFIQAEKALFNELRNTTLDDIGTAFLNKAPPEFETKSIAWFDARGAQIGSK